MTTSPELAPQYGAPWKVAVIDDDPAVHDGTRYALYDYVLNGQKLDILSAYSADEGRELLRAHPDIAVVLLDVVMETEFGRAAAGRVHPQRAQERDGARHPAHRPARPGAGAARHRRLRHQRLQGEDRAHRRSPVHRHDGGTAQLSADPAHGADPARARDHHRCGGQAVRLQVHAAAGRGRAHPDRLAAQRRMRRHSRAARRGQQRREFLGAGGVRAATASSPACTGSTSSTATCAMWCARPSRAASTSSSPSDRSST